MNAVRPTRLVGNRYIVLAELGRGGMGIVWRAEDRVMGRHVAVKELRLPDGLSPEDRRLFRERLTREARNAGRLNDPGIVTVHDVVSDAGADGIDYIVMELIEARTLSEVVAEQGPLDERAATNVAQQMLAALRVAHDAGVIHRDVKPSNVMITPTGRVKLTDFGIAQAADDPGLTTTGALVGSPAYVSPERLEGGPATPASDLWALGATLYYAVQGTGPFARESTPATISAVLHAPVPPTRVRGPLGTVIAGLLQRSPQARLSGVQAAALLASEATAQLHAGTSTLPVTPPRRRWVWPVIALTLVLGLVGGLAGGLALARPGGVAVTALTYGAPGDLPVPESISDAACLIVAPTPGQIITYSATVPCEEPHASEIFGIWDTYGTTVDIAYPGVAQMSAFGTTACRLLFESGLVVGEDKNRLSVVALVPSEASFTADSDTSGSSPSFSDRDVYCLLRAADGTVLEGSRIA